MPPCHNLEPSLVARDSSRLLSVKPNQWTHLSPFYTRMHGECLRYAKSTSQFHWRFLLIRDDRGFQVNPLCRHDITSPFPPSGNGGYVRNLDDFYDFTDIFIYIIPLKCNRFICSQVEKTYNVFKIYFKYICTFVSITCLFEVH